MVVLLIGQAFGLAYNVSFSAEGQTIPNRFIAYTWGGDNYDIYRGLSNPPQGTGQCGWNHLY
jgi:hypothetical protein